MPREVRCSGCARLLFKIEEGALVGALSIKCPRCRAFNHLRPDPGRQLCGDPALYLLRERRPRIVVS